VDFENGLIERTGLLEHQQRKLDKDWEELREFMPNKSLEDYRYYWLAANTRCFHWEYFKLAEEARKSRKRLANDDYFALCPFADYFKFVIPRIHRHLLLMVQRNFANGNL
jgi:hypothetical protein